MARKFGYCSRFNMFLALKNENTYTLYRGRCKMWSCPECSQYLRSKWRSHLALRIQELGGVWSFLTITAPSYGNSSFSTQLNKSHILFKSKMNNVMQYLRDTRGKFAYVRVLEIQKRGAIHAHILCNFHWHEDELYEIKTGKNKGKKYPFALKEYLIGLGFGQQVNIENLVGSPLQCSIYVTKYITKESREFESWLPKGTRYIQCSQSIGALNEHEKSSDDYTAMTPRIVGRLMTQGKEFYDADKKKVLGYADLNEYDEYEI